jgi:single-strand selective monofunctional uracil DNA glycosylase
MDIKPHKIEMNLSETTVALVADLERLRFSPPVASVYNPLIYARRPYEEYLRKYAGRPREIVLVGMNPGPWGMAQTGVPFGEVRAVKDWLGIEAPVEIPAGMHPKRPVDGFSCRRSEVSGKRLWGWAEKRYGSAARFFSRFFVANYCPLLFLEESGRNLTPEHLRICDRRPLLSACDRALRRTIEWLAPRYVIGIGHFSSARIREALSGCGATLGRITHPSPANPRANREWETVIEREFGEIGIRL